MATAFLSWAADRVLLATHPFHVGLIDGFSCLRPGLGPGEGPTRVFCWRDRRRASLCCKSTYHSE